MTREKTVDVIHIICDCYPNFKPEDLSRTINAWQVMLEEYSCEQVAVALKAYITSDSSGFAPSVGEIIAKIQTISQPQALNEMEAWALVSKALRNGYYGAVDEFNKLPPLVQKAVGTPDNLRHWSQTDIESIENVVQSNFMRSYRVVANREKEIERMPTDVRVLIESVNKDSNSAQIGTKNQEVLKLSSEDSKAQNEPKKCVPMPKEIKERIEKMKQ